MAQFDDLYGARLNLELNNSDSNVLYLTTRRQQAINDGVAEFAALTECYTRRSTLALSCNTAEYVLSTISDYVRIANPGVEYWHTSSGGGSSAKFTQLAGSDFPRDDEMFLNRTAFGWRQSTTPVSFPQGYYLRAEGGKAILGLSEPPSVGSSETVRVIVPYVARPQALTSSTDVPFTDTGGFTRSDLTEYHQAAVHFAAYRLLPLTGDLQGAQLQLQKFLGYVARYQQNTRPKGGQVVTLARHYLREARAHGSRDGDRSLSRDPRWSWS
jgi:hypothetical protein